MNNKRIFTLDEDALILRHIRGEISANRLQETLRCSKITLRRRANELGGSLQSKKIKPRIMVSNRRWRLAKEHEPLREPQYICTVGDDRLLMALREGKR